MTEKLPSAAQTKATRFRWMQTNNDGQGTDVWSIDSVTIIQDVTSVGYIAQFDLNIGCGRYTSSNSGRYRQSQKFVV